MSTQPQELEIQMELERLAVKQFALDHQAQMLARPDLYDVTPPDSNESRETCDSKVPKKKKVKYVLFSFIGKCIHNKRKFLHLFMIIRCLFALSLKHDWYI